MKKVICRRPIPAHEHTFYSNDVPLVLQRIYAARGIVAAAELEYSLQGLLRPNALAGLDAAVAILVEAIQRNQKICIVGDFDADGATSTALCVRALAAFGHRNVDFVVPNRFEFGYGLSPEIVEEVAKLAPDVLVTVDNGIASIDGVAAALEKGYKVVVTDHHLAGRELPKAHAIVNPNQPGCAFASKSLAGVGVVFYVLNQLRTGLREAGWFSSNRITEPNMAEFLDLVALGTVADVVPLDHNNRILVQQGLRRIQAGRCCYGIKALLDIGGRSIARLTTSDLGFAVGPRLNAAGRLDDMSLGIRCLLADSPAEAYALARELDDLNQERKSIEQGMKEEAFHILSCLSLDQQQSCNGVSLYKNDWHQGVVGILASRIKDKLHRPTIVFACAEPGVLKGSGRSIPGIHLRDVLDDVATSNPGLLDKFGGHAMAAGLSLSEENYPRFSEAFERAVARVATESVLEPVMWSDGALNESEYSIELARVLQAAGPWGQHFPEPVFDGVFRVIQQRIVGEKHLKLVLAPAEYSALVVDAIAFNCDLAVWPDEQIQFVTLVFKLSVNEYRGNESVQLMVDYIEPASEAEWLAATP